MQQDGEEAFLIIDDEEKLKIVKVSSSRACGIWVGMLGTERAKGRTNVYMSEPVAGCPSYIILYIKG